MDSGGLKPGESEEGQTSFPSDFTRRFPQPVRPNSLGGAVLPDGFIQPRVAVGSVPILVAKHKNFQKDVRLEEV